MINDITKISYECIVNESIFNFISKLLMSELGGGDDVGRTMALKVNLRIEYSFTVNTVMAFAKTECPM